MVNFWYHHSLWLMGRSDLNLDASYSGGPTSPADLRVLLMMTNQTAEGETDATTIGGFTDIDEHPDNQRPSLANESYQKNDSADRTELHADDTVFTALSTSVRQVDAALLYIFITDLASSVPLGFIDTGGFPFSPTGADNTINWHANGVLQLSTA